MIGNNVGLSGLVGQSKDLVVNDIFGEWFEKYFSYSYADYLLYTAGETKTFILDPTGCDCDRLLIAPLVFSATAGPILIDAYAGSDSDPDGTLLNIGNRRTGGPPAHMTVRLNPSNISLGVHISGDLVPASGQNAAQSVGATATSGHPFEVGLSNKYAITINNTAAISAYVLWKLHFYEVTI